MPTPFPGMDPYLERPGLWSQVHTDLIVDIRRYLSARLRPAVAETGAYVVDLPMPDDIVERYLEVRDVETGDAITVIEILSPSNKEEDRARYERKRLQILGSMPNLVEIDLLRSGKPMPMYGQTPPSHYRILISRAWQRPQGAVYLFNVRDPIPAVLIPLQQGESEIALPLNQILHNLYDQAGYDLFIDYHQPPVPPLAREDADWAKTVIG